MLRKAICRPARLRLASAAIAAVVAAGSASQALAAAAGDFIVLRDVPVRNALIPEAPGRAVTVQMSPDMSIVTDLFGKTPEGAVTPITDQAAAGIHGGLDLGAGSLNASAGADAARSTSADQMQLGDASMASSGGLGGAISGTINSGLAPMMAVTRGLGGMMRGQP